MINFLPDDLRIYTRGAQLTDVFVGMATISEMYDEPVEVAFTVRDEQGYVQEHQQEYHNNVIFDLPADALAVAQRLWIEQSISKKGGA